MARWIVAAGLVGFLAATLIFAPRVRAQQNIVTLYGCLDTALPSVCTLQAVAVDASGNMSVKGQ